jgi:ornithine decarboxylase
MCNADVKLGDLLIHEGSAKHAQKFAAKVFNADKTYFVLNGTSAANKVVTNALLTRGDLVLFDRNNHKSNHHGALIQAVLRRCILKRRVTRSALSAVSMSTALTTGICVS